MCNIDDHSGKIKTILGTFYRSPLLGLLLILLGVAALYSFRLGETALGASEAYSAVAAAQPTVQMVARVALTYDPGKPLLYHELLHWFSACFGVSEVSLRAFSVIFGLLTVLLVYSLARELFDDWMALAAALLWSLCPLGVEFSHWARMYTMFLAFAIGHLLYLAKLHKDRTISSMLGSSIFGAAMLYTHLGGFLILAADGTAGLHDWLRGCRLQTLVPPAVAVALFTPFLPTAIAQTHSLIHDHWLDWIGPLPAHVGAMNVVVLGLAAATIIYLTFGAAPTTARLTSLRWCVTLAVVPLLALIILSITIRPVFEWRYVAPSTALLAIAFVGGLDFAGSRVRNLSLVATAFLMAALIPLYQGKRNEPWRDFAKQVSQGGNEIEPIIFETGPFLEGTNAQGASGFPQGYFRVPFDYYFRGSNLRLTVSALDPARARNIVQTALNQGNGIWLISGQGRVRAIAELPSGADLKIESITDRGGFLLIHLKRHETAYRTVAASLATPSRGPAT